MIKGKDLVLYVNDTAVCYAQNCQLSLSADVLETTTFGSNNFKDYEYSKVGATIQHTGLTSFKNTSSTLLFIEAVLNRQKLTFKMSQYEDEGVVFSGTVLVIQTDLDAMFDAISTFKANLLLAGPLTITKTNITVTLPLADWLGMPPEYCQYGTGSLFPIGVYNVNGLYLNEVNSAAELISIWNSNEANQAYGVLTAGENDCSYLLTATYKTDELPKFIHIDVPGYVPPVTGGGYYVVYFNDPHWSVVDDQWVYTDSRLIGLTGYAIFNSQVSTFFSVEDGVDVEYNPTDGGFTVLIPGWYLLPNPQFILIYPNKYDTEIP